MAAELNCRYMMKRLKIRGITGMPLFIVRFHGRLDGKRNVVAFKDGKWEGHYLQKKEAIFHSFVHRTYRELEEKNISASQGERKSGGTMRY